jgi:uncharacterized membrane protein YqaE (UPF0057 family)
MFCNSERLFPFDLLFTFETRYKLTFQRICCSKILNSVKAVEAHVKCFYFKLVTTNTHPMKQVSTLLLIALTAIVFTGCSENTVGGGMIQKRKYTKGFYLNRHSSGKAADNDATADVSVAKKEKTDKLRPAMQQEAVFEAPEAAVMALEVPEVHAVAVTEPTAATQEAPAEFSSVTHSDNPEISETRPDNAWQQQSTGEKQIVQKEQQHSAAAVEGAILVILLVILAFFLPWLSVLLYEGATSRFWIILLLWLLAIIGFFWPIAYALGVIAVVFAILIVLGIV